MSEPFKVGLLLSVEHGAEDDIAARFHNVLQMARCAREVGFDFLEAPQHLLAAPNQYLHCVPLLSRVAAEVPGMRLGTNIIELTLHHPVEIAETLATLDVISGGNLCVGFGRGYREEEFASFGVAPGTRLSRFLESLELVKRLWTEDTVDHDGQHFRLNGVGIGIRPLQKPRPPIVLAASADAMVERTARVADGLTLAGHSTLEVLSRQIDLYREALAQAGKPYPAPIQRVTLETYVGPDMQTAQREAYPYIARKYQSYASWGQDDVLPPGQTFSAPIEALAEDRFIVGDPDHVSERLLAYKRALSLNELCVRMHWIGMPYAQYERAVRLFASSVLPRLKAA
ncbi:MAG: LLM class flavin-dependent oxidoreductase [Gammaproteobacteria bacterium]|nr:LLM class flavin-dependent oxidoreductase [Gammaproteobacteria bacterium]